MRRWRISVFILGVTALCVAQSPVQLVTGEIRRVGDRLGCLCGSCKNTVATCQMLECHYSLPARQKIAQLLGSGMTDDSIVASFVKERGVQALAVPPVQGFSSLAWVMPFVAIVL